MVKSKFKVRRSFKKRLIFILIISIILPLLAAVMISSSKSSKYITEEINKNNMNLALNLRKSISSIISDSETVMEILLNVDDIKNMDTEAMDSILKETVNNSRVFSQIYIMDKTGMQIYKTSGELGDRADRDYFIQASKGKTFFSDVIISRSTNQPIVVIAKPIKNNGEIVGVIGASIELDILNDLSKDINIGETGYAFVVDRKGKVISHPNKELIKNMEDITYLDPVKEVINGNTDIKSYVDNDELRLAAYTPIEKIDWGVVVQVSQKEAYKTLNDQKKILYFIIFISVLFALIIAYYIAKYVTDPLINLTECIEKTSQGDLTQKLSGKIIKRNDEFGLLAKSFNKMADDLKLILCKVNETSTEVSKLSQELAASAEQNTQAAEQIANTATLSSEGSERQLESVNETATATQQLSTAISEISKNSEAMFDLSKNAHDVTNEGAHAVLNVIEQMNEISETVKEISNIIKNLEQRSIEIGNIVELITGISEQTNLLALNASIEAARAGEHGKGFAVVADEVRKLAEQSKASANQIYKTVKQIQEETSKTVESMDKGTEKVAKGLLSTEKVDEAFLHINSSITKVLDKVREVSSAIDQIEKGSNKIVKEIEVITYTAEEASTLSQQNSAISEEQFATMQGISSSALSLSSLADELKNILNDFII